MFETMLDIRFIDENTYELLSPLKFNTDKYAITVKSGFKFNGGSVPKLLQGIECPMAYEMAYASAIHDALYASHKLNRKESDKILYTALVAKGMNKIKAMAIWKAVRLGGEDHYGNAKKAALNSKYVDVVHNA